MNAQTVRLKNIAVHIPCGQVCTITRGLKFSYPESFLEEKIGTRSLPVMPAGQQASDLCVEAAAALEAQGVSLKDIGLVVVCTQTPDDHGIPHCSAIVHRKLGLEPSCASFDISLGCSGYVYGLSIVKAFMEASGITRGLFFTCDPYSRIVDPEDQATGLLFGDAATVTLLEAGGPGWHLTDSLFGTLGSGGDAIHNRSGNLHMNGREVFNFALTQVPRQIRALLDRQKLSLEDTDLIVLHQGSRYMVEKIRERLQQAPEKVPLGIAGTGNTVSSSIPLVLSRHLASCPSRVLLSGFGVGLSFASALLEHQS